MCNERIDDYITKEEDENRYWGQLLAVSATTGLVGAAAFGDSQEAAGRGYPLQSLRKRRKHNSISHSLLSLPLSLLEATALRPPSLAHSAKTIAPWPRLTVIFLLLTSSTARQHLIRWRYLPLEISFSPESPITPLLAPSDLTGWATLPWLLLASL